MTGAPALDLLIRQVRVIRPGRAEGTNGELLDLGVKDGPFARIAREIPAADAREVFDGRRLLGFPGVVDAHTHVGIYAPHRAFLRGQLVYDRGRLVGGPRGRFLRRPTDAPTRAQRSAESGPAGPPRG